MLLRALLVAALGLSLNLGPAALSAAQPAPTFEAGEGAYIAGKFDEARALYAATAASSAASPKARASSLRQLGVMAWRLEGDNAAADRHFAEALRVGADVSTTHVERARFYGATVRHDEAIAAAEIAVATAVTFLERQAAALASARAILAKVKGVGIARQSSDDRARLAHAAAIIHPFSDAPPLPLDLSEALLEIALRLDDGPLALVAWRSYAREGIDKGPWATAAQRLAAALPQWRAGNLTPRLRDEIFEGLRISQFFALAALVAGDDRVPDAARFLAGPRVADTVAYARLIDDARAATEAYYRDIANGRANHAAWREALSGAARSLWDRLHFDGPRPAFTEALFGAEAERRFGAYINIGETGGVEDMHYGHVFIDDARTVEQYGRKAALRLIAVDRMVSNGYESWVWDGRQAHGGWANDKGIYQVRPQYTDSVLTAWNRLTDPPERAEVEERIARLTAGDDDIARRDPASFLPGLAARLAWSGRNAILDGIRKAGATGAELKRRFIVDLGRIQLESSIFAHEGRHALDGASGEKLDSEELEFRAKLSEVAFNEAPRVSFGGIINPNMADTSSPHGRANRRIMQGLVAWMDKHRAEINALDPARPLLPQFDKLTDGQMREAMRSMDPWAPKR